MFQFSPKLDYCVRNESYKGGEGWGGDRRNVIYIVGLFILGQFLGNEEGANHLSVNAVASLGLALLFSFPAALLFVAAETYHVFGMRREKP